MQLEAPMPPAVVRSGHFPKDRVFDRLRRANRQPPAGHTAQWARRRPPEERERKVTVTVPDARCAACELRAAWTAGTHGRTVDITPTEADTQAERARHADPAWQQAIDNGRSSSTSSGA